MIDCFVMIISLLNPHPALFSRQEINIVCRRIGLTIYQGQAKINGHAAVYVNDGTGLDRRVQQEVLCVEV